MASRTTNDAESVVALDPSTRKLATDAFRPHQGVLLECRDLVNQRLREALAAAASELDVELQDRRMTASNPQDVQRLIELQVLLRRMGADIDRSFSSSFEKQFQERAKTSSSVASFYDEGGGGFFPELSLVEDADIDDALLVKNLAVRLGRSCEGESQDLQTRVAFMLGETDIDGTDNPIGPTAICESLKEICWGQEASGDLRASLLELLIGRLGGVISNVYHEVNSLLVMRRVMPNVRARAKRGKAVQRIMARRDAVLPGESDASDVVKKLFSARVAELPEWERRTGTEELLQALDGLQKGAREVSVGTQQFTLDDAASAGGNVIARLLDAGLGKQVSTLDGIIIDVVATLFDYIFDDARVPDAMKGLIGRMQIPVLKLAMNDHAFFSNRAHPARRLINTLAQAGVTWDGPLTPESSLYQTAEKLVLRVQNEFADDAGVFANALEQLERYLAEQERFADERAATLTDRLKARERLELARKVATDALAEHLANEEIPPAVREFIATTWTKAMTAAALDRKDGSDPAPEGERWVEFADTVRELVWSVLPMPDAESRQKLVKQLPVILRRVKAGMQAAGLDEAGQKAFFAELVQCHATALKAGVAHSAAQAQQSAPPRRQTWESTFKPPEEEPTPELLELDLLTRGTWVELRDESGEVRRMRLTWISPARTMYLFANRQGQRALALTRDELKRRFSLGEARTADQEPLLDRVVDDVLDELRG